MKDEVKISGYLSYIRLLREELKKDLPGHDAQYRMAPGMRLRFKPTSTGKKAAVLILLYPYEESLFTVFIKRPDYPGIHGGQISLPGGKMEKNDPDITFTALRETEEEIGINRQEVDILGFLSPLFIPVSNMLVSPVVGFNAEKPVFHIQPGEVAGLIETAIGEFLKPEIVQDKIKIIRLKRAIVPFYNINGHHIWGATAMIISEFTELLRRIENRH
jgi:8-oxo-dGTP pyrophosphatase MutT (NUDIX family)